METELTQKPVYGIEPRAGWIETVEFDPEDAARHADAPGVFLLVDCQETIRDDAVLGYLHTVEKINDSSRLEKAAMRLWEIHADSQRCIVHAANVIRDGHKFPVLAAANLEAYRRETRLESHITDNMLTVSLSVDDLRVGDLLELERTLVTTVGEHPLRVKHYFETFWLAGRLPILRLRLRLVNRSGRALAMQHHRIEDGQPRDARARLEPGQEFTREYRDLLPKTLPATAPVWWWHEHLQVARAQEWKEVSRYLHRYYRRAGVFTAGIDLATFDRVALTGDRRVDAVRLVRFVQNEIRYRGEQQGIYSHTPKPAPRVLAKGAGDCKDKSNLLRALLGTIGVDANLALVNTGYGKGLREQLPSACHFDHMIVRVRLDGETRYFDPTVAKQAGDFAHAGELDHGFVLNLTAAGEDLVALPYRRSQPVFRLCQRFDLREAQEGRGRLTITREYLAHRADSIRDRFASTAAREIAREVLDWTRDESGCALEIETPFSIERDDLEANRVVTTEVYRIRDLDKQPSSGLIEIETAFAGDYPLPEDERFPLQLRADGQVEHVIEVEYDRPPLAEPSEENIANAHFVYHDSVRVEGCVLRFDNRVTSHREIVAVHDLAGYRDDVERLQARRISVFVTVASMPREFGWAQLVTAIALTAAIIGVIDWFV